METQGLGSSRASARARCHQGLGDCNGPSPILFYKRFREVVR